MMLRADRRLSDRGSFQLVTRRRVSVVYLSGLSLGRLAHSVDPSKLLGCGIFVDIAARLIKQHGDSAGVWRMMIMMVAKMMHSLDRLGL